MITPPSHEHIAQAQQRLDSVREQIARASLGAGLSPEHVQLIAVTKYAQTDTIHALQTAGLAHFAENRVQQIVPRARAAELYARQSNLPPPAWHMIGSLQRNKVRPLLEIPGLAWIHSIDSTRLADEIHRCLSLRPQPQPIPALLLQVNCSGEASKHGVPPDQAAELLEFCLQRPLLNVQGLMTMAEPADPADPAAVERIAGPAFDRLLQLRDQLARQFNTPLPQLSMGMSADFPAAIARGATMVRIGSALVAD